jgi:hypothetical protein
VAEISIITHQQPFLSFQCCFVALIAAIENEVIDQSAKRLKSHPSTSKSESSVVSKSQISPKASVTLEREQQPLKPEKQYFQGMFVISFNVTMLIYSNYFAAVEEVSAFDFLILVLIITICVYILEFSSIIVFWQAGKLRTTPWADISSMASNQVIIAFIYEHFSAFLSQFSFTNIIYVDSAQQAL